MIPTTELTLSGKVTSNGVRKTRLVLMNANVYTDVKPHPTLCAAGDSGGSAAVIGSTMPSSSPPGRAS